MAMLVLTDLDIDYVDEGEGPAVILLHSGASSHRQWRGLIEELRTSHRVLAPNAYGYGATTPWTESGTQTLASQARIAIELASLFEGSVSLVGHSMGGSVAMKVATMIPDRIERLVLLEPNPFYLLRDNGRLEAYAEVQALRDCTKAGFGTDRWSDVAERFTDYWVAPGFWSRQSPERQAAFERNLLPTYYEWDADLNEVATLDSLNVLPHSTLLLRSAQAPRSIRDISDLLTTSFPHWKYEILGEGGHMAPVTHSQLVNPIVARFLRGGHR